MFDGGDAIENWKVAGRDVWKQRYGNLKAINLGIGDWTQNMLWRVEHGELAGQNPKLIVLLPSFSNLNHNPAEVASGIRKIIGEDEARCPGAHILLLGMLPQGGGVHSPVREWAHSLNSILATLADGKKITFLNPHPEIP